MTRRVNDSDHDRNDGDGGSDNGDGHGSDDLGGTSTRVGAARPAQVPAL
jgi:hypothetical protein